MNSRRDRLLDTGIELLGERGLRAATHRRIDAAAGLPEGSTSNLFRTRDALLEAIMQRCAQRERDAWDELATREAPTSHAELARLLATRARRAAEHDRSLTLARMALLVEAASQPALRAPFLLLGARVNAWMTAWLRLAGSRDPEHHMHVLGNYVTGLMLHQLAIPDPLFDPSAHMEALLTALLDVRTETREDL